MLNPILTDRTTHEIECLAAEIFATTYNLSWRDAVTEAVNCFRDLVSFTIDWDNHPAEWALTTTARELAVMRETNCTAEQAIDAVRAVDGKMPWSEVVQACPCTRDVLGERWLNCGAPADGPCYCDVVVVAR